jgi:membrane-bound serine protease (ClpP class)
MLAAPGSAQDRPGGFAYSIELSGTIDPATENWIGSALDEARERGATVAIIRLDTPGGLDTAMRSIVQDILAAPMPVIVYVSPEGARAASAGLFVTLAGDVAAMSPGTNIGSATPVTIGGGEQDEVLGRKVENDAAAYVRALAEGRQRNADLAEEMVREATNATATEARERDLIDIVAASERELLDRLDGFETKGPGSETLQTEDLPIETRDMSFQYQVQQLLVNPTVAYLLLLAGLAGIAIEIFSPGLVGPGLFGAIALIMGLYGTAQLPVTAAGIVLLVLGLALIVAETQVSGGILGVAGVASIVGSALLLFDTGDEFGISIPVAAATGALLGAFTLFAASKAMAARAAPARGGPEELVGQLGNVRARLDPGGQVYVQGALWRARVSEGEGDVESGRAVRIESVEGLTLLVRPEPAGEPPSASQPQSEPRESS